MKRIIMVFFLILLPVTAFAQVYDTEAVGEYVMGDRDTKTEARTIALEHAKRLAIEQIGTYLESETVVKDRMLTKDEIRTYASAIIKTTVVSESINLLEDKTTVLKIRIKAKVDIGVLNSKIQEIKADRKRKEQIDALQAENLKLLKELESLSVQLKSGAASEYKVLRQKRESLLENLEKTQNSMRIAFEKGTLLNLALKSKDKLAEDKRNIDDALQFIADNIKFTLGEPQVRHRGDKADLVVEVKWKIEKHDEIFDKMGLFCEPGYYASFQKDTRLFYASYDFKGVNQIELFSHFREKKILLIIEAGKWKASHNIKSEYVGKGFPDGPSTILSQIELKGEGVFTIADIPIDRLKEITSISAKVVVQEGESGESTPKKKKIAR